MILKNELLETKELENLQFDSSTKGSYSTMQFVLKLNKQIRYYLNEPSETGFEKLQAFSTYLHETIHWWQHIGSNFGFILNSSFPSFAADSIRQLKSLIDQGITVKSVLKYEKEYFQKNEIADIGDINIITNNFYDIEYAKRFCLDNKNIKDIVKDRRFFLSMGHCFHIMWTNSIKPYSDTFDPEFNHLPNFNNWVERFKELEKEKIPGFYPDSTMSVSPLGIKAIFEGQAIFNQITYLKNVFKENNIIFQDFINQGYLHGIYLEAFDHFLRILEEERPIFFEDSLISLFLLVCDLSINPTNGFPLDIYDIERFIDKNNPGMRFIFISGIIAENKGYYLQRCETPSKETYIELSKLISKKLGLKCNYETLHIYKKWLNNDNIKNLIKEEETYDFKNVNMPFRLFFAKFIKIQLDKIEYPEIFCWIGHHMSTGNSSAAQLFEKHKALFTDAEDGEIKPIIHENIPPNNLLKTFNTFYFYTMAFELILKWISEEGEFKFDYRWLVNERNEEIKPRLKEEFKKIFGIDIDSINVI